MKEFWKCAFNPRCGLGFTIIVLGSIPFLLTIFEVIPSDYEALAKSFAYTGCFAAFLFDRG